MSLIVSRVEKNYGSKQVLKGIDFQAEPHEFVCILGHSGCGKSTLLNLVAGFLQPDSGSVVVNGKPVTKPSGERGVVFQEHALFPWYTVLDNVSFGPDVRGISKKESREIAMHYLKMVGLEEYAKHYPDELSGGMKQRVGIARALANEPEILLMDEPFGALDILTRETMQKELIKIWLKLRTMVLFITHSISEAIYLADQILVMKDGEVAGKYYVQMERPRSPHAPEFVELMKEIESLLIEEKELV